jgi:hypothetical protein
MIDVFIATLKDNIQHEVQLWEPKSLESTFRVARNVESKNMAMAIEGPLLTSIERIMFLLLKTSTYNVDTSTIGGDKTKSCML